MNNKPLFIVAILGFIILGAFTAGYILGRPRVGSLPSKATAQQIQQWQQQHQVQGRTGGSQPQQGQQRQQPQQQRQQQAPQTQPQNRPSGGTVAGNKTDRVITNGSFTGSVSKKQIAFTISLPKDYETSGKTYPVLYWLHGKGGQEAQSATTLAPYIAAAVSENKIPEVIMVFPDGGESSFYTDDVKGVFPVETEIIKDLLPYVDAHYRTVADRNHRLIMGFSMGGFGALKFAAKYPELFGAVVGYAAPALDAGLGSSGEAVFNNDKTFFEQNTATYLFTQNKSRVLSAGLKIRLIGGTNDTTQYSVKALDGTLTLLKIPHEYTVLQGVSHSVPEYYDADKGAGFAFLGKMLR